MSQKSKCKFTVFGTIPNNNGQGSSRGNSNYSQQTPQRRPKRPRQDSVPTLQNLNIEPNPNVTPTISNQLIRADILIGNIDPYIDGIDGLKHFKETVAKPPKTVLRIINTTGNFLRNKIDTNTYMARTLTLFLTEKWFPIGDEEFTYENMLEDEMSELITKIETMLDKVV